MGYTEAPRDGVVFPQKEYSESEWAAWDNIPWVPYGERPPPLVVPDNFAKTYPWNEKFQRLIEAYPCTTEEELQRKQDEIELLYSEFTTAAETAAVQVINEVNIPNVYKKYKKVAYGGTAGGDKFLVGEFLVKLVFGGSKIYGGSYEYAAKALGHELKGLNAFLSCKLTTLSYPLLAVYNYKGYRASVASLLPIDKSTILYGTVNGGVTFNFSQEIDTYMKQMANKLNLKEHEVLEEQTKKIFSISSPMDLEVHNGIDGRLYILDFARLLPPAAISAGQQNYMYLYRLLREEFVVTNSFPLSSDAFSFFTTKQNGEECNMEAHKATQDLTANRLTELSLRVAQQFENCNLDKQDFESLKATFHLHGVNLRYLSAILLELQHTPRPALLIGIEILARSAAIVINESMRQQQGDKLKHTCADFINSALHGGYASDSFWKQRIYKTLQEFEHYSPKLQDPNQLVNYHTFLEMTRKKHKYIVLQRIAGLTGIVLQRSVGADEWKDLTPEDIKELVIVTKKLQISRMALGRVSNLQESEQLNKSKMERLQRHHKEHPQNAYYMTNLADLHSYNRSKSFCEEHFLDAACTLLQKSVPESQDHISALEALGLFYFKSDDYNNATKCLTKVQDIQHKHFLEGYVVALEQLAWVAHAQQRYDLAIQYYKQSLDQKIKLLGEKDWEVAKTMTNYAKTLRNNSQYTHANSLFQTALQILQQRRPLQLDFAKLLDNMAICDSLDPNQFENAEKRFKHALVIKKRNLGDSHPLVAITQDHLAQLYRTQKRFAEAENIYRAALATLQMHFGDQHSSVAIMLHNHSLLYTAWGKYGEAEMAEVRSLLIFGRVHPPEHPVLQLVTTTLQQISDLKNKSWVCPTATNVSFEPLSHYIDLLPIRT